MSLNCDEFMARVDESALPLDSNGQVNRAKIETALAEAEGIIRGHLPFLVNEEGSSMPPPAHLAPALESIQLDIAFYRLGDRVSSDEDARARYKAAMSLLKTFSTREQDGLEGAGNQKAEVVRADSRGQDPRFWRKGYLV